MSKLKTRLMKRVLAVILSGAMVMSNMTAFASEAPADSGGYIKEVVNEESSGDDTERESAEKESAGESAETEVAETNADASAVTEEAAAEETTKSDDNTANAKETDEATNTEEADVKETSETEPLSEEDSEEKTENEDIKEVSPMQTGKTYQFNAQDITPFAKGEKADGEEVLLGENYFALICSVGTGIDTGQGENFYSYDNTKKTFASEKITQRINMGGAVSTAKQAVKFTTAEKVDVTLYWVGGDAGRQMSILDGSGTKVAETDEVTLKSGLYISTMTLETAGTYYLGGNSYIYKVVVSPAVEKENLQEWNFRDSTKFPESAIAVSKCAVEYHGLKVDTNNHTFALDGSTGGGKFQRRSQDIQVNKNTIIRIPLEGRSKVTVQMYAEKKYSVDGVASTVTGQNQDDTFICDGESGYAVIRMLDGTYLNKIKVEPVSKITVSGTVTTNPALETPYKVIFTEKTDRASKAVIQADVTEGQYTAELYVGASYTVSLSDEGYNVTEGTEISVAEDAATSQTLNIIAGGMDVTEITGAIKFPENAAIPDDLKIKFTSKGEGAAHTPEATIDKAAQTYKVSLSNDMTYTVTAEGTGVKDYDISPAELNINTENKAIEFTKKQLYKVNVTVKSFDNKADLSASEIIFTDKEDETYKYSFTGTDNIELRDGTYSMSMNVLYPYKLNFPDNLEINGEPAELELDFQERMSWDFKAGIKADPMLVQVGYEGREETEYNGLLVTTKPGKFSVGAGNVQVNNGTIIKIPVSGKGTVQITSSVGYTFFTIDGTEITTTDYKHIYNVGTENTEQKYVTLVSTGGSYLEKIIVEREKEVVIPPGTRKIDVWDFAGKQETDTDKFSNNITPAIWEEAAIIGSDGRFIGSSNEVKTYKFGDLTMTYHGQDRMYNELPEMLKFAVKVIKDGVPTNVAEIKYNEQYKEDGYKAAGAWYCNGGGTETTRNITIENVIAGDKIVAYVGKHNNGIVTYYFAGQGLASTQKESELFNAASAEYKKLVFIAENTGTYKIYPKCENNGKNLYHRIMRIPGVNVSGTIEAGQLNIGSNYVVKFINQATKQESIADVKQDGSFTVSLATGYTYVAVLSGAPGFGFTDESKVIEISEDSSAIENKRLIVEQKAQFEFSGTLTGFAQEYDLSRLVMTMMPPKDSTADEVALTIDKEARSFTALLDTDVEYTIQMEGADDYIIKTPVTVSGDSVKEIVVELKPRYTVSGGFIGLGDTAVTELKFVLLDEKGNQDNNYVYPATVTNSSYTVQLRDGAYLAIATVDGYKTQTHVVVEGKPVSKGLLFVSTTTEPALERQANIYVGYPNRPHNYKTVSEAVKAAKRMPKPASEAERITIHIAPGTYREQVIVDVPYITLTNDSPEKEVKITWYYGIGYAYYSIKGGYYDAERAYDKYEKANADRWGCAVRIAASDFRAENIIFENSFNRYITEEEILDGVELHTEGTDSLATFVRKAGQTEDQMASKAATERAAAIAIDADRAEFYQCEFYGSQDTVYTGSKGVHSYFKNCVIEGNTDFLFGDSNSVYENCDLSFAGYSDTDKKYGGYIAVNQAESQHGYLFWGCNIVQGKKYNNGFGDLGRPWRAGARVAYVNTTQETADVITEAGWQDMSGASAKDNPNYKEFNTRLPNGTEITPKAGSVRAMKYQATNPVEDMTVYFDSWSPFYLTYDPSQTVKEPTSNEKRSDVPKGTKITLTSATEGAKIYYTLDGTDPTAESTEYKEPFSLGDEEKTITIKAIAIKGEFKSNIAVFEYTVKDASALIAVPEATVKAGTVEKGTEVKLNCATEGAEIYYTTDGTIPTVKSEFLYRGQVIVINETTTIKAIAAKGGNVSAVVSFEYTVEPEIIDPETVEKPTSDRPDGVVPVGKTVTLHCEEGAKIYYTMDGTVPTGKESELYDGKPIALGNEAKTIVIKAIAVKGDAKSEVATFTYTVSVDIDPDKFVSAPVSDVEQGEVKKGTKVTLTTATQGATIYYTLDETEPTAQSTEYTAPIELGNEAKKVVIKAIAIKGKNKSSIATFAYTVTNQPVTPEEPDPVEPDDPGIDKENIWITGLKETYAYTGAKIIPDIKVWDCDITGADRLLAPGIDYTVAYKNNAKPGKADVIVTGKGNYVGKGVTASFNIEEAKGVEAPDSVKGAKIDKIKDVITYTGKAKHPDFKLTLKGSKTAVTYTFDEETQVYVRADGQPMNVNVAISNNVNKGTATILVSGAKEKNKTTSVKATFKILPADLSKATVKVEATAGVYAVKGAVPGSLTVTCDGKRLINGIDYTVKYGNNKKAGAQGIITVTGKGNYTKKAPAATFDINQLDMSKISVEAVTACEKMAAGKVKATVVDGDGNALKASQYTLKIYKEAEGDAAYGAKDVLSAGATIYVEAVAKDTVNLSEKTLRAEFKVGKDISKAKVVLSDKIKKGIAYTGGRITLKEGDLTVTLRGVSGSLKMGEDYELVAYSNNINKGTATAVIRGKGDYSGTKAIKFKITQKTMIKGN